METRSNSLQSMETRGCETWRFVIRREFWRFRVQGYNTFDGNRQESYLEFSQAFILHSTSNQTLRNSQNVHPEGHEPKTLDTSSVGLMASGVRV